MGERGRPGPRHPSARTIPGSSRCARRARAPQVGCPPAPHTHVHCAQSPCPRGHPPPREGCRVTRGPQPSCPCRPRPPLTGALGRPRCCEAVAPHIVATKADDLTRSFVPRGPPSPHVHISQHNTDSKRAARVSSTRCPRCPLRAPPEGPCGARLLAICVSLPSRNLILGGFYLTCV